MPLQIEDKHHKFSAMIDGRTVAVLPYRLDGDMITLKATRVTPDHWGTDLASEFFDSVLDGLHQRGKTVTILCPLVRAHVAAHPDLAAMVDHAMPGLPAQP